jgi:sterol desaturase/sphingolipid hydroxylase (fatty acid hydroxylase superfamily)
MSGSRERKKLLRLFDFAGTPVLAAAALGFLLLEARRALRKRTQSQPERMRTNVAVAAVAGAGLRWVLLPGIIAGAQLAHRRRQGLVARLGLPKLLAYPLAFLLLDYGNYGWHVLLHRWRFLWRFHNVHHTDLDLDVTTAWRFHVGEVLLGTPFRAAAAWLTGAPPGLAVFYEVFYEAATAFHHSNSKLPYGLEVLLNKIVVTPRMHGIHHSVVQRETDSNYSILFSWWDRLHGTVRLGVPQDAVNIGVPAFRDPHELTFSRLMALPFAPERPWQLPDGSVPERTGSSDAQRLLP